MALATVVALVWANSVWSGGYDALWARELTVGVGDVAIREDLRLWANDGLMAIFFLLIGPRGQARARGGTA